MGGPFNAQCYNSITDSPAEARSRRDKAKNLCFLASLRENSLPQPFSNAFLKLKLRLFQHSLYTSLV